MKFTIRREGTIASIIPLIYWYAAFVTLTEVITIAKILLNRKELRTMFKISSTHGAASRAMSPTEITEIAVIFLVVFFILSLLVNFYLIISRSRRWVKIWFVFFMLGSVVDLIQLSVNFDLYSGVINIVSAILNILILRQLFTSIPKDAIDSGKPKSMEPQINYQPGQELAPVARSSVQKSKASKPSGKSKNKATPKKKNV